MRDTFIIRLWAVTGDIHYVSQVVGHTDIKQTVEYARFTPPELLVHFPSLKKWLKPRIIKANSLMEDLKMEDPYSDLLQVTEGKWAS